MSSRAKALVAAALLLLGVTGRAEGFDVKLWPLFRYARNDALGELRWSALGPLIEYTRTPDWRDLRIRPLLWLYRRTGADADERAEVLFPLLSLRRQADYRSLRFLLLSARDSGRTTNDDRVARAFTLFPFVFWRQSAAHGTEGGILPFYLHLHDTLGWSEIQTILFPAYLRLAEPRVERRFFAFPFVSTIGGEDGRGVRVWPIYGTKEIEGRERTTYVLWPFHVRSERLVPEYGWERVRIDLPVRTTLDGPRRTSRTWAGYSHTIDELAGTESVGAPWPVVYRVRALGEEEWRIWRLAPLYGRSEENGIRSRFWAWPLLRATDQDQDDFHYRRRDAGLILWRRQWQWNEETGRRSSIHTLFPLLRSTTQDDRPAGQLPAVLDSIVPTNRGVLAMWAPLWGLLRWDTSPGGRLDWNVLWGLVARERGHLRGPWHLETGDPSETPVARPAHG